MKRRDIQRRLWLWCSCRRVHLHRGRRPLQLTWASLQCWFFYPRQLYSRGYLKQPIFISIPYVYFKSISALSGSDAMVDGGWMQINQWGCCGMRADGGSLPAISWLLPAFRESSNSLLNITVLSVNRLIPL